MLVRRVWSQRPTFDGPFADFDSVRREMQRLLDSVGEGVVTDARAGVFPPMNITQDGESFYLRAEIPGIKPGDLSITAHRDRVSIAGRREIPQEHERASYHRRERAEGSFNRTVTLPSEIDADRIDARCTDGVLTLVLPKGEQAKARRITVKT